jgi:selenide,water dikinase
MAIAILGWPINTIPPEVAREVIDGGRFACQQAGIALAGGHSIDAPEPSSAWPLPAWCRPSA